MTHPRLYFHLVWTTRDRLPLITADVAEFLVKFLPAMAEQESSSLLAIGMVSTHIHVLIHADPRTSIPRLAQRLKGASARAAALGEVGRTLRWAKGYSVTSVSPRSVASVVEYLRTQPQRHPAEVIPGWEAGFLSMFPQTQR